MRDRETENVCVLGVELQGVVRAGRSVMQLVTVLFMSLYTPYLDCSCGNVRMQRRNLMLPMVAYNGDH